MRIVDISGADFMDLSGRSDDFCEGAIYALQSIDNLPALYNGNGDDAIRFYQDKIESGVLREPDSSYASLSVSAIQEKAQREAGCEQCLNGQKYPKRYWELAEYKYCPHCGKILHFSDARE